MSSEIGTDPGRRQALDGCNTLLGLDDDKEFVKIQGLNGLSGAISICDGVLDAEAKVLLVMVTPALHRARYGAFGG